MKCLPVHGPVIVRTTFGIDLLRRPSLHGIIHEHQRVDMEMLDRAWGLGGMGGPAQLGVLMPV